MTTRNLAASLILLVLASAGSSRAFAWTPETRVRMTDKALQMMPASLRLALERYREPLLRGALEPMTEEDGPAHRPPWGEGNLDEELQASADALVSAVREALPFPEIARRFGELAHRAADATFPPNAAGPAGAPRYEDFAVFCETRLDRFPLVFHGHDDQDLDRGDFRAFTLRVLEVARTEDHDLARAYRNAGDPPDPAAFDDRSIPFAVGSLSYSRSVNSIVRVWLAAWRRAQGDLGRTPYMEQP